MRFRFLKQIRKKTPTVPKKSNGGLVSRPGNATEVKEIIEVTGVKEVMT